MRDFKVKLKIIWLLLSDQYTKSTKNKCFWMWHSKILITFDRETFDNRNNVL